LKPNQSDENTLSPERRGDLIGMGNKRGIWNCYPNWETIKPEKGRQDPRIEGPIRGGPTGKKRGGLVYEGNFYQGGWLQLVHTEERAGDLILSTTKAALGILPA